MGLLGVVTSITYAMDEMSYASYQPRVAPGGLRSVLPPPGHDLPDQTQLMLTSYFSEFMHFVSAGNNTKEGLFWMMTFDNDGDAADSVDIIDQLENDYQEAMIFGEEVAKTLLQLMMQYYDSEDYMYWLFGWLTGDIPRKCIN